MTSRQLMNGYSPSHARRNDIAYATWRCRHPLVERVVDWLLIALMAALTAGSLILVIAFVVIELLFVAGVMLLPAAIVAWIVWAICGR